MMKAVRYGLVIGMAMLLSACSAPDSEDYKPSKRAADLNNSAVRALNEKDPARALALVSEAISLEPNFYKAYANQAAILNQLGRPEDAAAALQKLVSIKPDYAEAYVPLGLFLEKLGKTEEAMAQYEKAAELFAILAQKKPKDSNPVINRAVALFLSNNKRQAVESLNAYLAQFPDEEYAKKVKAKIENTDRPSFVTSMEEQKSSQ
ncbi:MAG TPA: tetratricopeptide repeat protein [Candidatus Hydrogenedentes bacterium]|nr:tetratricopeptide repeat protein [Candidatus Hydrogenedentota bacterium]HOV75411.1 tetratricopeptide repeat protein [Candidatus Hydrogenedentota bacterium]